MISNNFKKLQQFFVGAFFVFICLNSFSQSEIKFEDKTQKFKKTKAGPILQFDYVFFNTGNQPLLLSELKVSCSCTKFEYPKRPIKPGESDTIHVTFDTNHKIGYQDRVIEIYSNASTSPDKIRFKGVVDN